MNPPRPARAAPAAPARGAARRIGLAPLVAALALLAWLLLPGAAAAQSVAIDLGQGGQPGATARLVQLTALIGMLSLAPSLLVMATAFARIVIVLALLRSAIGAQGIPPNPVLVGLALFLTFFVMQPVFEASWTEGILPMSQGRLAELPGLEAAAEPFRRFMAGRIDPGTMEALAEVAPRANDAAPELDPERAPLSLIVPSFMLTEIQRAFSIGFLVSLPFLIIDLVVAAVLMSMGMMMVPPAIVAMPFKLAFFVVADGWTLISEALVRGYMPAG